MDSSEARKTLGWTQGLSRSRLTFDGLELTSLAIGHQASLDRCSFIGTDLRQAVLDGVLDRHPNLRGAAIELGAGSAADEAGANLETATDIVVPHQYDLSIFGLYLRIILLTTHNIKGPWVQRNGNIGEGVCRPTRGL